MKYFALIVLFCSAFAIKAQYNLVPNYSFEVISSCPNAYSQLSLCSPWQGPTNNDADIFNSCSSTMGVPHNDGPLGFQFAHTGIGYAGAWMYNGINNNYREYIQTTLVNQLVSGKCYLIKFYCNLENKLKYAVNNISLAVTNIPINNTSTGFILNLTPQISKFANPIINDTLNWIEVTGIYYANGGEGYITIGNFKDDSNTDTLNTGNGTYKGAYYYFDDVYVTPIDSIGGMTANAGPDENIAIGDSVFIGQQISNLNCNWYQLPGNTQIATNTSGIYVKPNSPTTYVVEQNLCGTITYDTVNVWVSPTKVNEYEQLQNSVTIFPNPNNGNVNLQFDKFKNIEFEVIVTDITGKEIYTANIAIKDNIANFNLDVKSGTYFIKVTNTNTKEQVIKKLVIQK